MTKITSIDGNRQLLDGGAMFGNAPRPVWEKWIAPDELGRIPLACRSLLIEHDGLKILCETGIGAFFEPKLAQRFGVQTPDRHLLLENLKAHGHTPESIDFVILSHLHFDHAGGLLPTYQELSSGRRDLVFPKAQFLVGEDAWQRALRPHSRDRASFIPELTALLEKSGRLLRLPVHPLPAALKGRIEFIQTEGHTPGQMHTLFRGDQSKVFFCGDLIPGRPWVHLPITMGYDRFPEQLIDEKSQVYTRAEPENWWLFFTHDPNAAGAHVRQKNGKFEPVDVHDTFEGFAI
jgi:glyoxylase-like metal-dependent hydrolase (beta-lactamase superfamily II)